MSAGLEVAVVRRPGDSGLSVIRIDADGTKGTLYLVREVSCEIGGRAWVVFRLGAAEPYHVRLGGEPGDECDCMGFLSHGRCRHVRAMRALIGLEGGSWVIHS